MRAFFLAVFLITAVGWSGVAYAASHAYRLYVDGLACPFCAYGVEKHVGGLDNVKSVEILIDEGIVAVTMASGKALIEADAKQAISDSGFTLRKFEGVKDQ